MKLVNKSAVKKTKNLNRSIFLDFLILIESRITESGLHSTVCHKKITQISKNM
jgi:hypothetical protein